MHWRARQRGGRGSAEGGEGSVEEGEGLSRRRRAQQDEEEGLAEGGEGLSRGRKGLSTGRGRAQQREGRLSTGRGRTQQRGLGKEGCKGEGLQRAKSQCEYTEVVDVYYLNRNKDCRSQNLNLLSHPNHGCFLQL